MTSGDYRPVVNELLRMLHSAKESEDHPPMPGQEANEREAAERANSQPSRERPIGAQGERGYHRRRMVASDRDSRKSACGMEEVLQPIGMGARSSRVARLD